MADFPKKLVFIVGAGASMELGFPSGEKLKQDLVSLFSDEGNEEVQSAFFQILDRLERETGANLIPAARQAAERIDKHETVDTFIKVHDGYLDDLVSVAKLGITRKILEYEFESKLGRATYKNKPKRALVASCYDTYLRPLASIIRSGYSVAELPERLSEICIINFNYDRSLEHYLYNDLSDVYELLIEQDEVGVRTFDEIFDLITIVHPYGTVGDLPWVKEPQGEVIAFGENPNRLTSSKIHDMSKNLNTFSQGSIASNFQAAKQALVETEKICFLGFGFNSTNLRLLSPIERPLNNREGFSIFGTFYNEDNLSIDPISPVLNAVKSKVDDIFQYEFGEESDLHDPFRMTFLNTKARDFLSGQFVHLFH